MIHAHQLFRSSRSAQRAFTTRLHGNPLGLCRPTKVRPLKALVLRHWQAEVVVLGVLGTSRKRYITETELFRNKILLATWNTTFARGEGEQSQLMPHLRFSKSVNYSAVTLGRNSCWQLLRANSDSHFLEGDFLFLVAKKGKYYSTKKGEYLKESSTGSIFIGRNFDDGVARLSSRLI